MQPERENVRTVVYGAAFSPGMAGNSIAHAHVWLDRILVAMQIMKLLHFHWTKQLIKFSIDTAL